MSSSLLLSTLSDLEYLKRNVKSDKRRSISSNIAQNHCKMASLKYQNPGSIDFFFFRQKMIGLDKRYLIFKTHHLKGI